MFDFSMLSVLMVLLALASAWDVALHRIPNSLVVSVAATGLVAEGLRGEWAALGWSALAVPAAGAVLWPLWARRWVGGGDLKLGAAAAAWLGVARVPAYLLTAAVAIGAISVFCYAASARAARMEMRQNLALAANGGRVAATLGADGGRVQVPAGAGFAIAAIATLTRAGAL